MKAAKGAAFLVLSLIYLCFNPICAYAISPFSGTALTNSEEPAGVKIVEVVPNSPAAQAGLQDGDVITRIEDKDINSMLDFGSIDAKLKAREGVSFSINRAGRILEVTIGKKSPTKKGGSLLDDIEIWWDWIYTDPETGVRFAKLHEYEVKAEVPNSIDLTNHETARKLLTRGKDIWLYKARGKSVSPHSHTHSGKDIWLFKTESISTKKIEVNLYVDSYTEKSQEVDVSGCFSGNYNYKPLEGSRRTLDGKREYFISEGTATVIGFDTLGDYRNRVAEEAKARVEAKARAEARARAEAEARTKLRPKSTRESWPTFVIIGFAISGFIGLLVVLVILLSKKKGPPPYDYGYSSSSSHDDTTMDEKKEKAKWPWQDSEVIISRKNVVEKGWLGNTKVGHVEKNFWGEKKIYKDGIIFSEEIGKVETNFWGTPTSIVDKDGNKIGNIKTTWTGSKIIIDESGNEIGEYKG